MVLVSCESLLFEPVPVNDPEALFENLWTTFETDYAPFEQRNVNWQEQYEIFRPQVTANTTDDELYLIFTQLLRTLNDGHISLVTPNRKIFNSNIYFDQEKSDSLFNLDLIESKYLNNDFEENGAGGNIFGKIGNIGYWHIRWISDNLLSTDEILDFFETTDGLIIDLRNNAGGDMTYTFSEMGRLTDQVRFTHRSKTKNGPGADDYTEWYNWDLSPGTPYFDKPIVLITDRYTISAGERTTMALKTLPNLTHIGDTTNGAHSTKIGKELPNGWYYSVSPQIIEVAEGVSMEGIGLIPDILVKNTIEEIEAGRDKSLEAAIAMF
jgi:carboxyl-terminal processing protease